MTRVYLINLIKFNKFNKLFNNLINLIKNLIKTKLVSSTLRTVVVKLLYFSYAFRVTNAHFVREFNNTTRSACIYT